MENILEIKNLSVSIGDKQNGFEVVSDVSISVPKGKVIGIACLRNKGDVCDDS